MTNDEFIDLLQQQQLIPGAIARQLRAKADQGDARVTPKSILKYLVKKELVSRTRAKQLLETTLIVSDKAESSILGLVPLVDVDLLPTEKPGRPPAKTPVARPVPEPPAKPPAGTPPLLDDVLFAAPEPPTPLPFGGDEDELSAPSEEVEPTSARGLTLGKRGKSTKKKARKPVKKTAKKLGKSEWDSPLLLLGGGAVALLGVASLVLWWLMFRETADAVLKQANDLFDRGAYQQASEKYKYFVDSYGSHQDYSDAKVRLRMTSLWEAVEGRKDFSGAAKLLPEVVADIENEDAFISAANDPKGLSEAKQQLSTLIARIATGLAGQAEKAKDDEAAKQKLAELGAVLELSSNTKYVPERLRMDSELDAARETLQRVQTRQQRDAELAAALTQMDEAIARGEPAAALAVRAKLLVSHPTLADDPALAAKVVDVSAAEMAGVKFVKNDQPPPAAAPASPIIAELALAERGGDAAAAAGAPPTVVRVDGALYGLNSEDGSLLWRRYVGADSHALPLALPEGRIVAADVRAGELVCLAADSGKLQWRVSLAGKFAAVVAVGQRLLVPSEAGKLYIVDATSGALAGHVQFSQPLRVAPVVNDRGDRVYVVGDHSSLYTLSAADFSCVGVFYLGHAAGGVSVPPVAVLNKVLVADNSGAETCRLRVIGLDDKGAAAADAANHRLSGLVVTPLSSDKRRLAVTTSLGQAAVFEIGTGADQSALTVIAAREAPDREQLARFTLLDEGHLWIAARQLAKLAVLPTGNQFQVQSLEQPFDGDVFDYPLQKAGNLLIHVRRPAGRPGAIVAATDPAAGRSAWQTTLAVPPAGAPAVDAGGARMAAGSASGAVYLIDREAIGRRVQDQPARLASIPGNAAPFTSSLDLGQGRVVLGAVESPALLHFRPGDPRQPLTAVELPGPLSGQPAPWRGGFVAASDVGQVTLYNSDTAAPMAAPFQPELQPGKKYKWLRPAVVGGENDSKLAISDGVEKLYLLNLVDQPQPNLAAVAMVDVGPSPLNSPLAVLGTHIVAGAESGKLARFAVGDLAPAEPIDLGGRIAWGPHAAGAGLLMALDTGELALVAADGTIAWRRAFEHGALAGTPLVAADSALVLHSAGGLAKVSLADGAEQAYVDLGQPVAAGPAAFGPRVVLAAPDGALLIINSP